jgi:D-alanyl-D-alanine carboxypeptidase
VDSQTNKKENAGVINLNIDKKKNKTKQRAGKLLAALLAFSVAATGFSGITMGGERASQVAEHGYEVSTIQTENERIQADRESLLNLPDWPEAPEVESDAAILMDARTGNILYGKNIDEQYYPASITKVLTALIACEQGNMSDMITYSYNAIYSVPWDGTTVGFSQGEQVSLLDSLYGMMLASGNEAALGIAEYLGGSEEAFEDMMNERAAEAGAINSHFVNANGLHDDDHYTTAYDMAMILRAAVQNDLFLQIASAYSHTIEPTNMNEDGYYIGPTRVHRMLNPNSEYYNAYVLAGKTGYTSKAGNTLVTYAKQGDTELICVILHSHQTQYTDTQSLLDYGFSAYACYNAAKEDTTYTGSSIDFMPFLESRLQGLSLTVKMEDTYLLVPATASFSDITSYMEYEENPTQSNLLGYVHYEYEGIPVGTAALTLEGTKTEELMSSSETGEAEEDSTQSTEEFTTKPAEENEGETKKIVILNVWHILGYILLGIAVIGLVLYLIYYFSPGQRRYRRKRKMYRSYGKKRRKKRRR